MFRGAGEEIPGRDLRVWPQSESFFKKVNIHILQCDDKVRQGCEDRERVKTFGNYMDHMELHGMVGQISARHSCMDQMIKAGKFSRLRDSSILRMDMDIPGGKCLPYDTAFVFMWDNYTDADVPPWAMKAILDPESMEDGEKY